MPHRPGELAALLTALKDRSGLSYARIGQKTNLSKSAVHRFVAGAAVPQDFGTVERIATACGADRDELDRLYPLWAAAPRQDPAATADPAAGSQPAARLRTRRHRRTRRLVEGRRCTGAAAPRPVRRAGRGAAGAGGCGRGGVVAGQGRPAADRTAERGPAVDQRPELDAARATGPAGVLWGDDQSATDRCRVSRRRGPPVGRPRRWSNLHPSGVASTGRSWTGSMTGATRLQAAGPLHDRRNAGAGGPRGTRVTRTTQRVLCSRAGQPVDGEAFIRALVTVTGPHRGIRAVGARRRHPDLHRHRRDARRDDPRAADHPRHRAARQVVCPGMGRPVDRRRTHFMRSSPGSAATSTAMWPTSSSPRSARGPPERCSS